MGKSDRDIPDGYDGIENVRKLGGVEYEPASIHDAKDLVWLLLAGEVKEPARTPLADTIISELLKQGMLLPQQPSKRQTKDTRP